MAKRQTECQNERVNKRPRHNCRCSKPYGSEQYLLSLSVDLYRAKVSYENSFRLALANDVCNGIQMRKETNPRDRNQFIYDFQDLAYVMEEAQEKWDCFRHQLCAHCLMMVDLETKSFGSHK